MDTISFPTSVAGAETLTISADAEIMQNYQTALPVAANQHLEAVQDVNGDPMIFSIGSDQRLYLIMSDPGGPTGWQQIDLTDSFAQWGAPQDFAVGQMPGGAITLVVAAQTADGATHLAVAGALSNDPAVIDWAALGPYWIAVGNPQPAATLDALFVGPVDATGGFGVPFVAVGFNGVAAGAVDNYLLVPSVSGGLSWSAKAFPTPTDSADLRAYAMGAIADLGVGLYMLYENLGGETMLVFRTLTNEYGHSYVRELSPPADATCLASVAAPGGTTDLYVAGQGVVRFAPDAQTDGGAGVEIAPVADIPDIEEGSLMVRTGADGAVALWGLSGEQLMSLATTADGGWGKAVVFEPGVASMAPLRDVANGANQLAFFKTDVQSNPSIIWMWQDPATSIWQRDLIPIQATGEMYQFDCYTTTLTLLDALQRPLAGFPVKIGASGWTRVIINGAAHVLDTHTTTTVVSDLMGQITLINPVADLATPHFTLSATAGQFAGTVNVNPAWPVYQRLQAVKTGADIPDSVLSSALPDGVTKDDVAGAIARLMALTPDSARAGAIVTWQADDAPVAAAKVAPTSHTLRLRAQPKAKTTALAVVDEIWDDVTNLAGDLWQFATSVIDEVVSIVVEAAEEALTFVVNLVGKTIRIVLKTMADILKAITYVLKAVATVFEKIIEWLGFLFGWQDIWDGHKVMANAITSAMSYVIGQANTKLDDWKAGVHEVFTTVKTRIHQAVLPAGVASADLLSTQQQAQGSTVANPSSAPASFTTYQLQHGGGASGSTDQAPPEPGNPLVQFYEAVVQPTLATVEDDLETLFEDIAALFQGNPTVGDFMKIVTDVIDTFLDVAETLIVGFLDLVKDLLVDLQALITEPLEIPFFSDLYRFLTGLLGEAEDLSLVNVISLIVAIPATILYKAGTNSSPFPDGVDGLLDPDIFEKTSAARRTGAAMKTTMLMAITDDADDDDSVDKGSFSYIYSHYLACGPAILSVTADILGFFTLDRRMKLEIPDASLPLTDSGKKALEGQLGWLERITLACDVGSLMLGFPIPDESGLGEAVAVAEWLVGVGQTIGSPLIDKVALKITKSEKIAKGASAGWDGVLALVDAGLLLTDDILENADVVKYFQDLCSVGGTILQDVGEIVSVVPGASSKGGALGFVAAGTGVKAIGALLLVTRIFTVAVDNPEMWVQFH